ncbi:MAG: hypothetical protein JW867_00595 [Candidatus Omnitrophica bacterium]|nr:hypothetical protein [Candidatus Omnitrophota bacterium]
MMIIFSRYLTIFFLITTSAFFPGSAAAQPSEQYLIDTLDLLTEKTLEAYMLEDYISFYQYFAKKMEPVTEKQHFDNAFIKIYKEDLGNVISRKLLLEKSKLDRDFPVLVYKARFEKFEPVLITVNFANEYDRYRITRIRFDRVYHTD